MLHGKSCNVNLLVVYDRYGSEEIIRKILTKNKNSFASMKLINVADGGLHGVMENNNINLVLFDVEGLDSFEKLEKIKSSFPDIKIIIITSSGGRNGQITVDALIHGVEDFIERPISEDEEVAFLSSIFNKVSLLSDPPCKPDNKIVSQKNQNNATVDESFVKLESFRKRPPEAIAIASSTGGPMALAKFLNGIGGKKELINTPIFITQHMPAIFTTKLAESINKIAERPCVEASDNENVRNDTIYIAPGDYHMCIEGDLIRQKISLNQNAMENYCRPAADPMIRSLIDLYGNDLLLIVLTGMGSDGLKSAISLNEKGGKIIAQNQETSVVWGMPGAVANAGICHEILPIDEILEYVVRMFK